MAELIDYPIATVEIILNRYWVVAQALLKNGRISDSTIKRNGRAVGPSEEGLEMALEIGYGNFLE